MKPPTESGHRGSTAANDQPKKAFATEVQVEVAFSTYLQQQGWSVSREKTGHVDLLAHRGTETLYVEVKGHTKSPGAAIDIGYGQLLRRMDLSVPKARFALVVPDSLRWHAERVSVDVRRKFAIELYTVGFDGAVNQL